MVVNHTSLSFVQNNEVFQLREMTIYDLDWVWKTRNQELVRKNSVGQEIITQDQQRKWFASERVLDRMIFTINSIPQGVVTRSTDSFWSFYLSEEVKTGQGLATLMLMLYLRQLKIRGVERVRAYVKMENLASQKIHKKLGFKVYSKDEATQTIGFTLKVQGAPCS